MTAELHPPQGRSETRATVLSTVSQLGAKLVHLVLNVVSTLAVIRYLAPEGYGTYVLVLTVTTVAGVVADFGLPKLAVREAVRPDSDASEVIGTIAGLRLGLALGASLGIQLALLAFGQGPAAHLAGAVASLVVVGDAVLGVVVVVFQIHLAQHLEAAIRVASEAVETGLVLVLIAAGAGLPALFAAPAVGVLLGTVLALWVGRRRFGLRPRFATARLRGLVREALPLGPGLLVGVLYLKLDSIVVAVLRPSADLGLYGSACQPIEYVFLASAVVINVLFPLLARCYASGQHDRFAAIYRRGSELLFALAVAVPVVMLSTAVGLVELAYGPAYAAAAGPMRWLALALVPMTINGWQALVLLTGGHQRVTLAYNLVALGLAVPLDVLLVWAAGIDGAGMAAALGGLFVLCCSTTAVRRRLGVQLPAGRMVLIAVAGGVAALTGWAAQRAGAPWALAGLAAVVLYGLAVARIGVLQGMRRALA